MELLRRRNVRILGQSPDLNLIRNTIWRLAVLNTFINAVVLKKGCRSKAPRYVLKNVSCKIAKKKIRYGVENLSFVLRNADLGNLP